MSDTDDDALGIQAFQHMTQAVDRFGATLQATELRHKTHADAQTQAAIKALHAAQTALEASQNALQASRTQIRSSLLWSGAVALGALLAASSLAFHFGQSSGWDQGQAAGYASARQSNADASWANTPSGQRALSLDRAGSLDKLVECSQPGWRVTVQKGERLCFVDKAQDGKLYGWAIP